MAKPCIECDARFTPRSPRQRYCSPQCRWRAKSRNRYYADPAHRAHKNASRVARRPAWSATTKRCTECGSTFTQAKKYQRNCDTCIARKKPKRSRPKVKPAHHRGSYHVDARRVRDAANDDPATRCWRCGRTLAEVRLTKPKARWTAGHIVDGQVGGPLAAECSPCNFSRGAQLGQQRKRKLQRSRSRTPLAW